MGYRFREIICGYCEHRFVYDATPGVLSFDDETVALPFELRDDKDEIETPIFYED